jgi:hypothetical protein
MDASFIRGHNNRLWEFTVIGAIIITVVLFIVELTVKMGDGAHHFVESVHVFAFSLLIVDLGVQFNGSKDKWKFVRKNLLIIISLFPIATLGMHLSRSARMIEFMRFFKMGSFAAQSTFIGSGVEMGLRSIRPLAKSTKLMKHLKKEIIVNVYEEPYCDHHVVNGIIRGARHFAEKYYHAKIIIARKAFSDLSGYSCIEKEVYCGEKLMEYAAGMKESYDEQDFTWNLIITKHEVTFKHPQKVFGDSRIIEGSIVSVFCTDKISTAVFDSNEKHWKSAIIGYHNLTHLLQNKCDSTHCIFNINGFSSLNHNYYLLKKFGNVPYCSRHSLRVSC